MSGRNCGSALGTALSLAAVGPSASAGAYVLVFAGTVAIAITGIAASRWLPAGARLRPAT